MDHLSQERSPRRQRLPPHPIDQRAHKSLARRDADPNLQLSKKPGIPTQSSNGYPKPLFKDRRIKRRSYEDSYR